MKIAGFDRAAKITLGNREYYYALYDTDIKAGDKVLVSGVASGDILTVKDIVSAETAFMEVGQPLCSEVICRVDTSAYDARVKQRKKKEGLRNLMETMITQMDEVEKFKACATYNPELSKLLEQYNGINV